MKYKEIIGQKAKNLSEFIDNIKLKFYNFSKRARSSAGRAFGSHPKGHGFKSHRVHQTAPLSEAKIRDNIE